MKRPCRIPLMPVGFLRCNLPSYVIDVCNCHYNKNIGTTFFVRSVPRNLWIILSRKINLNTLSPIWTTSVKRTVIYRYHSMNTSWILRRCTRTQAITRLSETHRKGRSISGSLSKGLPLSFYSVLEDLFQLILV